MARRSRVSKTETLRVRLTPAEREGFAAFCAGRNLNMSEALRRMARAACGYGPTFDQDARGAILELASQQRAVGVNLNQAVKALHLGRVPQASEIETLMRQLAACVSAQEELYHGLCGRAFRDSQSAVAKDVS
jgi:hypothetical protein